MNQKQLERMQHAKGFIAALDQSGGSTPKALKAYGVNEDAFSNDEEMYGLVHEMRTRIIKSPSFNSDKILGAILFENTMDRLIDDKYTADYLWDVKGVVPFLKIDQGLQDEDGGMQLMKPISGLEELLERANKRNVFGTKMRSVIHKADKDGIRKIVEQQFEIAKTVIKHGLVPIIEPEVDINITDKAEAEAILKDELLSALNKLDDKDIVIFKLSIPTVNNLYESLMSDKHVARIVALSGGYSREKANELLAMNKGLIASFSRALSEGLSYHQTEQEFDTLLNSSITSIFEASIA